MPLVVSEHVHVEGEVDELAGGRLDEQGVLVEVLEDGHEGAAHSGRHGLEGVVVVEERGLLPQPLQVQEALAGGVGHALVGVRPRRERGGHELVGVVKREDVEDLGVVAVEGMRGVPPHEGHSDDRGVVDDGHREERDERQRLELRGPMHLLGGLLGEDDLAVEPAVAVEGQGVPDLPRERREAVLGRDVGGHLPAVHVASEALEGVAARSGQVERAGVRVNGVAELGDQHVPDAAGVARHHGAAELAHERHHVGGPLTADGGHAHVGVGHGGDLVRGERRTVHRDVRRRPRAVGLRGAGHRRGPCHEEERPVVPHRAGTHHHAYLGALRGASAEERRLGAVQGEREAVMGVGDARQRQEQGVDVDAEKLLAREPRERREVLVGDDDAPGGVVARHVVDHGEDVEDGVEPAEGLDAAPRVGGRDVAA